MRLAAIAVSAAGMLGVGCGPAPGYEPEPQAPAGYYEPPPPRDQNADAVAAQQQAEQQGAEAQAPAGAVDANGQVVAGVPDVAIGESADEYSDTDPSALTEFKPTLDGHGRWVDDSTYGTVWVPSTTEVGSDFEPYVTAGHWTYDDDQSWVWVSDYDWGWAPFHYGRWVYLGPYGWSWIPGRRYAGAWVSWRTGVYGYDYVGWAPMAPDWYWYNGYAVGWGFGWYYPHYSYCPRAYVYRPVVATYVVRGEAARSIEAHTQPYHPATPAVAHTAATPSVGHPGAGGVTTTKSLSANRGPSPGELGIRKSDIAAPPSSHQGLSRAQALATPSTAMRVGAAAPYTASTSTRPRRVDDAVAGNAPRTFGGNPAGPRTGTSVQAFGASRVDPVARAPQVQGVAPTPSSRPSSSSSWASSSPSNAQPFRSAPSGSSTFRAPPSTGSPPIHSSPSNAQSFRSTPSSGYAPSYRPSTPSYSSPSRSSVTPSYRPSTPSISSRPSMSSSPSHSTSVSRPSVTSRPSSGGVRASGGHRR